MQVKRHSITIFFRKKKMLQKTLKDVIVKGKNILKSVGDAREKTQYFYFFLEKNKKKKKKVKIWSDGKQQRDIKSSTPCLPYFLSVFFYSD